MPYLRQLEMFAPQLVLKIVLPEKQPCSQVKGIQLIDARSIEPQQLMTTKIFFHQIPVEYKEWNEPQVLLTNRLLTPRHLSQQPRSNTQ